jgi:hypothetical protein
VTRCEIVTTILPIVVKFIIAKFKATHKSLVFGVKVSDDFTPGFIGVKPLGHNDVVFAFHI